MQIAGTGFTTFQAAVKPKFQVKTKYALNWIAASDGNWLAADRGTAQDVYQTTVTLYKAEAAINTFIDSIEDNRVAGSHVITLSAFASTEHIFGADVNHSGSISATVLDISDRKQQRWKTYSIRVTLQAIAPTFSGSSAFPALKFLYPGYTGDSSVDVNKIDSYDGTFAYTERNAGAGFFEGDFIFTTAEMQGLRRFIATNRATAFNLTGINGVTYPFGIRRASGYPYSVRLVEFEDKGMIDVGRWRASMKIVEVV